MSQITKVYLLNVPLESDYKHTLYFDGQSAQQSYFAGRVRHSFTDFSYQRKDSTIRIPKHIDDLWDCNYVMYQNFQYGDRWFYAFITDMEYINDNRTDIKIQTDCMQTWFFDYTSKPCFVEREHVDDDTVGLHTVPEMLETGEYVCQNFYNDATLSDLSIILSSTYQVVNGEVIGYRGGMYDGIFSGTAYKRFTPDSYSNLLSDLNTLENVSKSDGINGIFLYPTALIKYDDTGLLTMGKDTNGKWAPRHYNLTYNKLNGIKGHVVKNNKLLTYPYNYILVSNNAGACAIYHQELFDGEDLNFQVIGCITPGGSIKLVPLNYKGAYINYEESLNAGKFPVCSWVCDMYTNWLSQNSVNITVDVLAGVGSIVAGAAATVGTGGLGGVLGVGSIVGGVTQIASTVGQVYQHSMVPAQSRGNLNSGDVTTAVGQNNFTFYYMCIKPEYAKIIDDYFTCFGYKVNKVKKPNENHRPHFWYTKCIDYECDGAIPNKDMQVIKDCYNRGITFWRNANEINDYSVDNTI